MASCAAVAAVSVLYAPRVPLAACAACLQEAAAAVKRLSAESGAALLTVLRGRIAATEAYVQALAASPDYGGGHSSVELACSAYPRALHAT